MAFQKPQILWFLLCLAIPIIIHFIRLRKSKTVYFPGVFRLEKAEKSIHQNRQIKHWLLLINRLLILSTIILSFAQPSCKNNSFQKNKIKDIYIWLDLSPSMYTINETGQTSLEIAKSKLINFLESSPSKSVFHFYNYEIKRFELFSRDNLKEYVLSLNDLKKPVCLSDLIISNELVLNDDNFLIAFTDRRGHIWNTTSRISQENLSWIDCNSVGDFNNRFISDVKVTDSNSFIVTVDRLNFNSKEDLEIELELDSQFSGSKKIIFEAGQKQIVVDLPIVRNYQNYLVRINPDEYPLDDMIYGHKPISQKIGVYLSKPEPLFKRLIDVLSDKFELDNSLQHNEIIFIDNLSGYLSDSIQNLGLTVIIPVNNKVSLTDLGDGEWFNDTVQLDKKSFSGSWFEPALSSSLENQTQLPSVLQYWKFESIPAGYDPLITTEDNNPILLARNQEDSYHLIWLVDWNEGMKNLKQSSWFVPVFSQLLQLNNKVAEQSFGIWGNDNKLTHPLFLNHSLDLPINIVGASKEWIANLEISPLGEFLPLDFNIEKSGFHKIKVSERDSFIAGFNLGREESINMKFFNPRENRIGTILDGNLNHGSIIHNSHVEFSFLYLSLLLLITEIIILVFGNKTKM